MLRTGDSMGGEPIDHSVQRLVEGGVGASLCELVRADLSEKFFQNIDHRKRVGDPESRWET